ncbi:MAG: hypothetical protein ACKVS9_08875 [Phycisphaerae bacterium]
MYVRAMQGLMLGAAMIAAGCGLEESPFSIGVNQTQVNRIRTDATTTGQEKREALRALGIDDLTINAILRDTRTANQFGGDLRTAFNKVVGGTLSEMTPDEVQIYGDATAVTTFSDSQAQTILDFFVDAAIDTRDDLEQVLDDDQIALPSTINEDNLRGTFVTFDPNDLIDDLPQ